MAKIYSYLAEIDFFGQNWLSGRKCLFRLVSAFGQNCHSKNKLFRFRLKLFRSPSSSETFRDVIPGPIEQQQEQGCRHEVRQRLQVQGWQHEIRQPYRYRTGNRRLGNRYRAGNVKATGKDQDLCHFTDGRSARSLRSLRSRPRYEEKKLRFLGQEKIKHFRT